MVALGVFSSRKKARFTMQLTDFDYVLPEELIAQFPADKRDESRLMMLDRKRQAIDVGIFSDITRLLTAGDLLVINDTRVIPARLLGRKATGGKIEVFLVRRDPGPKERWECMTKSSHPPQVGSELVFSGELSAVVVGAGEGGFRTLEFFAPVIFSCSWKSSAEFRFRPISSVRPELSIVIATRPFSRGRREPWPRQPPACISLRRCWSGYSCKGSR
jgi:S-adenosylmethionine:tRNA ribosyltransferase-isomerase